MNGKSAEAMDSNSSRRISVSVTLMESAPRSKDAWMMSFSLLGWVMLAKSSEDVSAMIIVFRLQNYFSDETDKPEKNER